MENLIERIELFEIGEGLKSSDLLINHIAKRAEEKIRKSQDYDWGDEDGYEVYPDCDYNEDLL